MMVMRLSQMTGKHGCMRVFKDLLVHLGSIYLALLHLRAHLHHYAFTSFTGAFTSLLFLSW